MASRSELTLLRCLVSTLLPSTDLCRQTPDHQQSVRPTVELDGVAVSATLPKRNSRATPTGVALSRFSSPAKSPSRPISNQDPEFPFSSRILPVTQTKLWSLREAVAYLLREAKCPLVT